MNHRAAAWPGLRSWLVPGPIVLSLLVGAVYTWVQPQNAETVGFIGMIIGFAAAGFYFLHKSRPLPPRERVAWMLLGIGAASVSLGVTVVGVLTESGLDLPAFGWVDIFFLGSYLTLITALYKLAKMEAAGRDWVITILDAAVGGIALAALAWVAFFHDLVEQIAEAPWWEALIAVTYPVAGIVAAVGLMILVMRRSHYHLDIRLMFLAIGMAVQVAADFIYLDRGVGQTFAEADPAWPLLLLAAGLLLSSAVSLDRLPKKREFPETDTPFWALIWPYLLATALITVHVTKYATLDPKPQDAILLDAVLLIGAVVFLRQLLVINRNRVRVENQRSELVSSVSHELRTPLTAMVGYLTLLNEESDDFPEDARREMIAEATDQARHMARLVSDLVMLARDDQRKLPLEMGEATISTLISASLRNVSPEATKITAQLDKDGRVFVDVDRIQQALSNLLANAVKYGGDTCLLRARISGNDLIIEVHDNGGGVPTRYETVVWRRFERGAHRLDANNPGLGIGLAIVDAVAEAHGGKASYRRSERLGGACFSLVLPACVVAVEQPADRVHAHT